ncbi:MAG: hypothetical protein RL748_1288 [Pseudomonadota bacterium]|jgi:hypothetical protein
MLHRRKASRSRLMSRIMTTMKKTPKEILKSWLSRVNKGEIDGLIGMYHTDAILIPTFSSRILKTPESIRDYFERLATREELSVALHDKTLVTQILSEDICTAAGIYCWRFAIDGQLLNFEARFSYLLNLTLDSPIVHHHSSQIPRVL